MPDAGGDGVLLHATAIAIGDCGILLRGPSGAGKSDLGLRCVMRGASPFGGAPISLVGDDYVVVSARLRDGSGQDQHNLDVQPASTAIAGLIEVRGLGVFKLPARTSATVGLIVDLVMPGETVERLPRPEDMWAEICGVRIVRYHLSAFEASAPDKIIVAATCMRLKEDQLTEP